MTSVPYDVISWPSYLLVKKTLVCLFVCLFVDRFRFLCRSTEAFLLAQMPSNMLFRLQAKDPGYVREPNKVRTEGQSRLNTSSIVVT